MGGVPVLLMVAALGINYGWMPDDQGGVEYIIQVEPDKLAAVERAGEISSTIPAEVQGHVSRVVVRVGTGPVPRESVPRETPTHMVRKTGYGSVRSSDQADTADLAAPTLASNIARQSFKPDPEPQGFGLPEGIFGGQSRPSTSPQSNSGQRGAIVPPPKPSTRTDGSSANWYPEGQNGNGTNRADLSRPSTTANGAAAERNPFNGNSSPTSNRTANTAVQNRSGVGGNYGATTGPSAANEFGRNPFGNSNSMARNNTSPNSPQSYLSQDRDAGSRVFSAGARLGDATTETDLDRGSLNARTFGPETRAMAEQRMRSLGGAADSGEAAPRPVSWYRIADEDKEFLAKQGWNERLYDGYREQGGMVFKDVLPMDRDGYLMDASGRATQKRVMATADVLAAYPNIRDSRSDDSRYQDDRTGRGSNTMLGNPNGGSLNNNTAFGGGEPAYGGGLPTSLDPRNNRGSANLSDANLGNGNFGNGNLGYGLGNTDSNPSYRDDRRSETRQPRIDDRRYEQSPTSPGDVGYAREAATRSSRDYTRDDPRYRDELAARDPRDRNTDLRSYPSDRLRDEQTTAATRRSIGDPRDGYDLVNDRRPSDDYDRRRTSSIDNRLVSTSPLAEKAKELQKIAQAERDARELAEAQLAKQSAQVKPQRLFNTLLLLSVVGNVYLAFWLKNLFYRYRDMVAAKRSSVATISSAA